MENFYKTRFGRARQLRRAGIALLLLLFLAVDAGVAYAQNTGSAAQGSAATSGKHRVTGTVTDTDGTPLVGATVYIQNTSIGTTTNTDGLFVLDVNDQQAITISYIGYLSQTLAVHGRNVINVQLKADTDQIEEVVVVGYGKQKRQAMVSSIATVGSRDLMQSASSNLRRART